MSPFELGYSYFLMRKSAAISMPRLQYAQPKEEEPRPNWKQSVGMAAKQVFGIEDKTADDFGYGVTRTKIGDKQVAPPYRLQSTVDSLHKKWNTQGKKPTTVGSGTRESPNTKLV